MDRMDGRIRSNQKKSGRTGERMDRTDGYGRTDLMDVRMNRLMEGEHEWMD